MAPVTARGNGETAIANADFADYADFFEGITGWPRALSDLGFLDQRPREAQSFPRPLYKN
jgi:hypothetical protein